MKSPDVSATICYTDLLTPTRPPNPCKVTKTIDLLFYFVPIHYTYTIYIIL